MQRTGKLRRQANTVQRQQPSGGKGASRLACLVGFGVRLTAGLPDGKDSRAPPCTRKGFPPLTRVAQNLRFAYVGFSLRPAAVERKPFGLLGWVRSAPGGGIAFGKDSRAPPCTRKGFPPLTRIAQNLRFASCSMGDKNAFGRRQTINIDTKQNLTPQKTCNSEREIFPRDRIYYNYACRIYPFFTRKKGPFPYPRPAAGRKRKTPVLFWRSGRGFLLFLPRVPDFRTQFRTIPA